MARGQYKEVTLVVVLAAMVCATCEAFYNPQQGRWLSRDPMFEEGSVAPRRFGGWAVSRGAVLSENMASRLAPPFVELRRRAWSWFLTGDSPSYLFVNNDPVNRGDPVGLAECACGAIRPAAPDKPCGAGNDMEVVKREARGTCIYADSKEDQCKCQKSACSFVMLWTCENLDGSYQWYPFGVWKKKCPGSHDENHPPFVPPKDFE